MATTYNPFDEMARLFEEMRTAFWGADDGFRTDRPAGEFRPLAASGGTNLDLTEQEGEYVLSADLPGFEREEITLSFDDGVLAIVAEREEDEETVVRSRAVHERVSIPAEIDEEAIAATYRNGVLTVRMPVVEPMADSGHVIEIED